MNINDQALLAISILIGLLFAPDAAPAQEESLPPIAVEINAGKFLGRYTYRVEITEGCKFLLKEINPKCPDQRGEISFNMTDVRSDVDDLTGALGVASRDGTKVIKERLYYKGNSVRGRRFCDAPEGAALTYQDKMHYEKFLFYSDNPDFLYELMTGMNELSDACRASEG